MKKTFITALALIGACSASLADDYKGSQPVNGGTYYLYNVGAKQFLGIDGSHLVLGGERAEVTLEAVESATTPGFFRISSGGEQWGADLFGTPSATGDKFTEWRIEPVIRDATGNNACSYLVSSRNSEASASLYLYDSNIMGGIVAMAQKPHENNASAQWLLVSMGAETPVYTFSESDATYQAGEDGTAEVRLRRNFNLDAWNMFCSPVDITAEQIADQFGIEAHVAELTGLSGTEAQFSTVTSVKAGSPCIVYVTKKASNDYYAFSGSMAFAQQASSVVFDGVTFQGTLATSHPMATAYVFSADGKLQAADNNLTVNALAAYLVADNDVQILTWSLDGETAIGAVSAPAAGKHDVFTTAGEKVKSNATNTDGLKRGVYIMGGKKKTK